MPVERDVTADIGVNVAAIAMTRREFRLPDLGEGLTESDIVAWRIAEGDTVELNQIIADIETAKALVELPSPYSGVVAALHAHPGETVNVGDPLVTFEIADPESTAEPDEPDPNRNDPERPDADQLDTDQPDTDQPDTGEPVPPNLVGYGASAEGSGHPRRRPRMDTATTPTPSRAEGDHSERRPSTPPVRVLARRLGVDLESVTGTGEHGLVTRADVEAAADTVADTATTDTDTDTADTGTSRRVAPGDTHIPIAGVRKHTAAAMVASAFTAPQVTVFHTIDVTAAMDLLAHLREHPLAAGPRVTLLTLVAHAVCAALARHPSLNSSWDGAGGEIVQHGVVNLGIAAATTRGLIVPNIPDAGSLGPLELAERLDDLTTLARSGRTPVEHLRGGTFTITNIGVFGVDAGTPLLNPGEAGILALGAAARRPWEYRGEVALRDVLTLSLTFDHRLVDGEQGSRFIADVGSLLAEPALALLTAGVR